ncbi:MAG: AAA family ATPase [Candidatus Methanoplasma sp.]|nr:AAA family ATPase [Candidatus Methanoplasma sp.]
MYRLAYEDLLSWKNSRHRKPLILEGVRQCGKTFLLKEFGNANYDNVVYLNFEGNDELIEIFRPNLDVGRILSQLAILSREKIEPGKTLIIFDEIQFCSRALTSLKYFYENAPEYHIACAGSLLGVLMSRPYSFPVGKVDRIRMGPMSFKEFLMANGEGELVKEMDARLPTDPFIKPFTSRLEFHLSMFLTIGGMPAAVMAWVENRDINEVDSVIDNIIKDYEKDFAKHATESVQKLTLIWNSVPEQLTKENKKFMFGHVKTGARARDLEDALEWLIDAGLIHKVKSADPSRLPLPLFADSTHFKIYLADVGIFRRMAGLDSTFEFGNAEGLEQFKGAIVENYVLNEMICSNKEVPFYWRSDGRAEVDFVIQYGGKAIPVEVKSGHRTDSKSLNEYLRKFDPETAVIISMAAGEDGIIKKMPLYWAWRMQALFPKAGAKAASDRI